MSSSNSCDPDRPPASCRHALHDFLRGTGSPADFSRRAPADDPESVEWRLLEIGMAVAAKHGGTFAALEASLEAAAPLASSTRAHAHVAAGRAWLTGDPAGAARIYSDLAREHPTDLLAVRLAQSCHYFLGNARAMLDGTRTVLGSWTQGTAGYDCLLALHAFALAENGCHAQAEAAGHEAVALTPRFPFAIHAVAHALHARGRLRDALRWLEERAPDWVGSGRLTAHIAWHWALLHVELGRFPHALALYDAAIAPRIAANAGDAADAAALLWRLQLLGVDAGNRWQGVAEACAAHLQPGFWPYYDVNAAMAFAASGRSQYERCLSQAIEACATGATPAAAVAREVTAPLLAGIKAFVAENYVKAAGALARVGARLAYMGGSREQREVILATARAAAFATAHDAQAG
jgi:tetratricopeptide (TPR) repeat protein